MKPLFWIFATMLTISAGCAHAQPQPQSNLEAALRDNDFAVVQAVAADRGQPRAERALAAAAIDYWQLRDDGAGPALVHASVDPSLSADLRRDASIILSDLRLRQSRYAESLAALDAALPNVSDPAVRADLQQTRTFIAPLVNAPAMQVRVGGPGSVALTRDATSHMRAQIGVNNGTVDAIVDTGSGVSTLSLSNARRLGVHMLTGQASIGTATSAAVTTGLAIADKVTFGGAEFRNVIFLVMPDEALTFASGAYVVHAIIGLPLLMPLGRVEYTKVGDGATETLRYGPSPNRPGANSNLLADGVEAVALARADDGSRTLRFFIDNGAPHSHLNRRFVADFPEIAATGQHQAVTTTGGGGSETQQDALRLPSITLHIGDGSALITDVPVIDDHHAARHGDIGLDALEAGAGYVLDFQAMRLELLR
jgi:predicted aspartyl protease